MSGGSLPVNEQLLYGIIALQNNFVTREQLVAAFDAWVHDKSRRLVDILRQNGALSAETLEVLCRLVDLFLARFAGDPQKSLGALSPDARLHPALAQLNDSDLEASLGNVGFEIASGSQTTSTVSYSPATPLGRFQVLRPHARGGLGQVSVALDRDLNREVALKEILPKHADNPISRERFLLEAEITGGLEHPGIVPVYALGHGPDGRPFYAMRFVKGDSLKQAIEEFHHADLLEWNGGGTPQVGLRQLLRRFLDVCNALEYAHSRGVVHRDVKPGNIMVGKYGETLLVDWGLAKTVGKKELVSEETTLRPSSALSSSGHTQPGSAIGTPAYMSPEQVAGKLNELGPASDVYSLGATLYHLLCGKPPFEKENQGDLLQRVQRGDFPRPRSIAPTISRPLEAITLKAMALDARDRYRTARALADDLEHWLADEPLLAAPDTLGDRISRFSRKHKGYVRAGGMAAVVLTIVSVSAALLINEKRLENLHLAGEEGKAKLQAQTAQAEAEKNQGLADERAEKLRVAFAWNYFDHGIREYEAHRARNAVADLTRALALMPPEHPLYPHLQGLFIDRCLQGKKQLTPPLLHSKPVYSAAFSPDGMRVVTASEDKSAKLWDVETGAPVGISMQHDGPVMIAVFSPDGTQVLTGSSDKTARLWDARTGAPFGEVMRHKGPVKGAAFSPDGMRILTESHDATAQLWDARTGAPRADAMDFVNFVTFNSDGSRFVTAGPYQVAQIWDSSTGARVGEPIKHDAAVYSAAFSPDGDRVATGSVNGVARLWDAHTGGPLGEIMEHRGLVRSVNFSPDGTRVVTIGDDETARIWDGRMGTPVGQVMQRQGGFLRAAFNWDGTRVITGGLDNTAHLWDGHTGFPVGDPLRHQGLVNSVAFSPDAARVVTASDDGTARIWHAHAPVPVRTAKIHDLQVTSIAFSADGTHFVTGSQDGTARFWDALTMDPGGDAMRHPGLVKVAFSADGARVVTASSDHMARLWNASTGTPIGEPMKHDDVVCTVAFSPDGTRVITGSYDNTARIWDARTTAPIGNVLKHRGHVTSVDFSRDGRSVITGSLDSTARLWDAQSGDARGQTMAHDGEVVGVAFSPDGTRVVTASGDRSARLWNAHDGTPLGKTMRHENSVFLVHFSPDGTQIVTADNDSIIRLFDAFTGVPVRDPMRHQQEIWSMAISPDGTRIVTGCDDNTARFWDARTGVTFGETLPHELPEQGTITAVAFCPDSTRLITGSTDGTVSIWDLDRLALENVSLQNLQQLLQLWSGFSADEDGTIHELTPTELDEIRSHVGQDDLFRQFAGQSGKARATGYHRQRALAAGSLQRWSVAIPHWQQLVRIEPDNPDFAFQLASTSAEAAISDARYAEGAKAFQRLIDEFPRNGSVPWSRYYSGAAWLAAGNREKYASEWNQLYEAERGTADRDAAGRIAYGFVPAVPRTDVTGDIVRLAEISAEDRPAWRRVVGAALYRDGQYDRAVSELTQAMKLYSPNPWDWLFLAMSQEKNGNHDAAVLSYTTAESRIEEFNRSNEWKLWHERIEVAILQREAAKLLKADITHAPAGAGAIPDLQAAPRGDE